MSFSDKVLCCTSKTFSNDEYYCELTQELDKSLIGASDLYKVYILDTRDMYDKTHLALRVPGCTVGHLDVNEDLVILGGAVRSTRITRFTSDVDSTINKYKGYKLEFSTEGN